MKSKNQRAPLHTKAPFIVKIKVIANAQKTEFRGMMADGTWKVAVAAAPEKGKANAELVRFLAEHCQVSRGCVIIERGETSTRKIIKIFNS